MKLCIVDDEELFSAKLENKLLELFPTSEITIINTHYLKIIDEKYDICFFDIMLKDSNGIELAYKYQSVYPDTIITFISSYSGLVYTAQFVDMFYFLRKEDLDEDLRGFKAKFDYVEQKQESISIFVDKIKETIFIKDIFYIQTAGNNCYIYSIYDVYKVNISMKVLLQQLNKEYFCRINQHEIINLKYITYIKGRNVNISRKLVFEISRRMEKTVVDKYSRYKFNKMIF